MATPYAPGIPSLPNFDASMAATATWTFSSSDTTVKQQSFRIWIYNNQTGAQVLDTGWMTSSLSQYVIPAYTLVNRTQYKWQVQVTDSAGNTSPLSQPQVFTCSSAPTVTVTTPTPSQVVASNVITIAATYQQLQSVPQQSYQISLFAADQQTIVQASPVVFGTANQLSVGGLANGQYFAQVSMTSADGLTTTTATVPFTIAYTGGTQSPSITPTPLPIAAAVRIDWHNPKSIPGTYVGPGAVYQAGLLGGEGVQVAAVGEKVYWSLAPFTQFTYTSWWQPNLASSNMRSNQIVARLQADNNNFIQMRYDPLNTVFILEVCIGGSSVVAKSASGITFAAGAPIFVAIKQSTVTTAYVGVAGAFYTIVIPSAASGSAFGVGTYGTATYTSSVSGIVTNLTAAYIGCGPADGNEANAIFSQTTLTSNLIADSAIQSLYSSQTVQTFTLACLFVANFDGSLEGGDASAVPIAFWNVVRSYSGLQNTLGTVTNTGQATATFTDPTPLSGVNYVYNIVPVDVNGNAGTPQMVTASVSFDGWWLTDPTTSASFQLFFEVGDVAIPTNYHRTQYETSGVYPVIVYGQANYRSGKIDAKLVGVNNPQTAYQQYQALEAMINSHRQLVLRGDEGWGLVIDAFNLQNTVPTRNHKEWNKVEFEFTEVAPFV